MLITAAPSSIARKICRAERSQPIGAASGTFSARAPGQTPRMPWPLAGAAATAAVAVPCNSVSGTPPSVRVLPPANSGWVSSRRASMSAISGLLAVTGGGASAGLATAARQSFGGAESGSSATAWRGSASVLGWA
jgi:hypothetical protein